MEPPTNRVETVFPLADSKNASTARVAFMHLTGSMQREQGNGREAFKTNVGSAVKLICCGNPGKMSGSHSYPPSR